MSAAKVSRQLTLLQLLLEAPSPRTAEQIRGVVKGYSADKEAFRRTFERDKTKLSELIGHPIPHQTVPYFWSDQYGLKFQMLGSPRSDDEVHLVDDDGRKFLAYYSREGLLTGVVGAGRVGKLMKARQFLVTPTPVATLLEG